MTFKLATQDQVKDIMVIIDHAQKYLASLNIDQWQDGYPENQIISNDISNQESYCVVDDTNQVIATTMFTVKGEPTYNKIDGEWLTTLEATYGVIHRLAVLNNVRGKGLAKFIFNKCEELTLQKGHNSLRVDTHQDNLGMQSLLKKLGYTYCGIIYLERGGIRLAFEKVLKK